MPFVRVCRVEDLSAGPVRAESETAAALVVEVDGTAYAVSDVCRHRAGRLSDGVVRDGVVTCPQHWWRYDVRTGRAVAGGTAALPTYPVRVVDGWVEVDLPHSAPEPSMRERLLAHARAEEG